MLTKPSKKSEQRQISFVQFLVDSLQDTPSLEELKLKYYQLLIRYHSHNNSYIDICRCYKAIYETDSIAEDPAKWQPVSFLSFALPVVCVQGVLQ